MRIIPNNQVILSKTDIINFIYLFTISPSIFKYGLSLYSDNNINNDIGLTIMLMGTFIFIANGANQIKSN
jgi:hypothetical protein